ncbi:thioesterase superfamily protein [Acidothermus cellulolyticus 11B]|jgi:acyl-CoA hydrolase|uniref:Thioesterase superfamily protein n=1 Tax=Acidothermus cellulolyticus (strain ATCC 43068 / DSM 8971 / 11B) TaxID=351607 RepID=A0LRX4_ACIC1|nr:acyl-CoA thioesterase [Acidothermus cellulolyticus]ABK52184.1 thioesterase superfamily protein [Acidothermus cellulolyticus 11B]MCL6550524.1 acyl-CoA thioesterase [Acidothermus cellulolyticus]
MTELRGVPVSASRLSLSRIATVLDANLYGIVHGGTVMRMIDETAGAVASRHCGGRAVTVAVDEMVFLVPVHIGDIITCQAQVNWTGRTSCEIGVRVTAQPWDRADEEPRHVASAYLVFVAIDENERPRAIPPVIPETEDDHRRFHEAEIRRGTRLARREAILRSRERARPR